jgi:hypothetical protein
MAKVSKIQFPQEEPSCLNCQYYKAQPHQANGLFDKMEFDGICNHRGNETRPVVLDSKKGWCLLHEKLNT